MVLHMKSNFRKRILTIFFLSACLQNIAIISFGTTAIKLYHLVGMLLFPLLLNKRKIKIPPKPVCLFAVMVILISLLNAGYIGINSFIINYLFAFYGLILVMNIGVDFSEEDWCDIVRIVAIIMSVLVWVNMAVNYNAVINFIRDPYRGHPELNTFFGGGVNLEASYLAMMAAAFINDTNLKRKIVYNISIILICILYSSRSALLLCLISVTLILINENKKKWLFLLFPVGVVGVGYTLTKIDLSFFLERFQSLSTESGVLGRFRMWTYAWQVFQNHIIGYGIGNSIPALIKYTGVYYSENNFHNVYIQMFIDLGLLGGVYYLGMVVAFFLKEYKRVLKKPIQLMMALYFIACLLEFRGAEIIIYFYFAAYFQQKLYYRWEKHREKINYL